MNNLQRTKEDFNEMRQLTLDLLDAIPEDKLSFSVGENMGSIGKQYRHIADVHLCYNKAIETGLMSFDKYKRDYSIEKSKEKLKKSLKQVGEEMSALVDNNPNVKIDWFGDKWDLTQHIRALTDHEILHHGELIVYIMTLDIKFPESWELWGL